MSSLRFTSFGAATVPLSKIIVDKDLVMGPYAIKGVYRPEEWETEELDWGSLEPEQLYDNEVGWPGSPTDKTIMTVASNAEVIVTLAPVPSRDTIANITIKVNEVVAMTRSGSLNQAHTFPPFIVNAGDVIVIKAEANSTSSGTSHVTIESTGKVVGEKTFDLSGKWLALGIDMGELDATVKIYGEEVPYSDYAKYFPLVPTEIKIPGNWSPTQERPEIRVYK